MNQKGVKSVFLIGPNYAAGKDMLAGVKSTFKGEVVGEEYTVWPSQLDFSAELAKIQAAKPDALFTFMPGGMGVNLVKEAEADGATVPVLSAFTVDESTLPAQQDAALGLYGGMTWAPNLDNPANRRFVDAYLAAYHAVPASYAMQGYDAAQLIDSALTATGGATADRDRLRAALRKADLASPRGTFRFNTNGYPIQDFYVVKAAKRPDGLYETEIVQKIFSDHGDAFAQDCPLK
jgi:branched-chain amino acid transport system substrate-binding protein